MKYSILILIVFCSCGTNYAPNKINEIDTTLPTFLDTLQNAIESVNVTIADIPEYVDRVELKMKKLQDSIKVLENNNDQPQVIYVERKTNDNAIADLNKELQRYKNEVNSLNRQLAVAKNPPNTDHVSMKESGYDKVYEPEKPSVNSLVLELDKKTKNGDLPIEYVDIYAVPYSRKAKKELMKYQVSCDLGAINFLGGRQASFFNGQYFFNDLEPGKYIIKICYYYGGYEVVTVTNEKQIVKMQVSPPVQ